MIEQILLLSDKQENIKLPKSQENFLLSLLKNDKISIFEEIIKNLQISKEDIKNLIKKEPKEIQQELLEKLQQIDIKTPKIEIKPTKEPSFLKETKEDKKTKHTKKEEMPLQLPQESKIVEFVKKEISAKYNLDSILKTQQEIKEFKSIKTIKELVNFANKKGLNIKHIVIETSKSIQKSQTPSTQIQKFKPQITPKIPKINQNIPKFTKTHTKEIPNTPKTNEDSALKTLLLKKTTTIKPQKTQSTNNSFLQSQHNTKINTKTIQPINQPIKVKNTTSKHSIQTTKHTLEDLIQTTPKTEKNHIQMQIDKIQIDKIQNPKSDEKPKIKETVEVIPQENKINQLKYDIIKAKESIKHFANNLQEAIENYKPPISKVSIELHPKELGKVEITLVHRGDNLQIHVNGQNQTINFFNTNQQELKAVLVNMGYSDVNMSFNQQQQQRQQKQYKEFQNDFKKQEDEFIIEIPYQYA